MNIHIVSVGNKPRPAISDLITTYETRLPRSVQVNWTFIKHGVGDLSTSMHNEAEKILKVIPDKSKVILLDETGKQLNSEEFADKLIRPGKDLCFIIGGSYGVSEEIFKRADSVISLSKLVFPHQIVRIVLAEQIYRAHTINTGHPYHHS